MTSVLQEKTLRQRAMGNLGPEWLDSAPNCPGFFASSNQESERAGRNGIAVFRPGCLLGFPVLETQTLSLGLQTWKQDLHVSTQLL